MNIILHIPQQAVSPFLFYNFSKIGPRKNKKSVDWFIEIKERICFLISRHLDPGEVKYEYYATDSKIESSNTN